MQSWEDIAWQSCLIFVYFLVSDSQFAVSWSQILDAKHPQVYSFLQSEGRGLVVCSVCCPAQAGWYSQEGSSPWLTSKVLFESLAQAQTWPPPPRRLAGSPGEGWLPCSMMGSVVSAPKRLTITRKLHLKVKHTAFLHHSRRNDFKVFSIGKTWHKVARSWRNEGSALPTVWGCCTLLTPRGSCTSGWTPSSSSGLSWTGGEYSGGSSPYLPLEKLQTSSMWLLRTRGSRSWNTVRLRRGKDETQ